MSLETIVSQPQTQTWTHPETERPRCQTGPVTTHGPNLEERMSRLSSTPKKTKKSPVQSRKRTATAEAGVSPCPRVLSPQHTDVLSAVLGGGRLQPQSLSAFAEPRAAEENRHHSLEPE